MDDRQSEIAIAVALYRQHAEQRERRRERWLTAALTSIDYAAMTTDLDGRLTFLNTAAQKLTGWAQEDGRSRHIDEVLTLVDGDDRSGIENAVTRVLSGTNLCLSPYFSLVCGNGERVPVDGGAAPIRDTDGAIIGVVLVFQPRASASALRILTRRDSLE